MKRYCIKYYLLILGFLISCEKKDSEGTHIRIETISQQDYNYRYDDLQVIYQINFSNLTDYRLKCRLINEIDNDIYSTSVFHLNGPSATDTLSLWTIDWLNSKDSIEFYNIENKSYRLQISLFNDLSNIEFQSNKLTFEINRSNPDTTLIDNFTLFDIYGDKYELVKLLENKDYVFMFEHASWCGWSKISIAQVNQINSLFDESITVLGVEGSNPAPTTESVNQFIINRSIMYPTFLRLDNLILNSILHPDNVLSFPRFVLINKERKEVYRQIGYIENMIDSIQYYVNKN